MGGWKKIKGLTPSELARLETLENNEYKLSYFAEISTATGTITIPAGATILLDQFDGGADAFASTISMGQVTADDPVTAGGAIVDVATFDALGNYTLTGVPNAYPVALIYNLKISAKDFANLDISKEISIREKYEYTGTGPIVVNQNTKTISMPVATSLANGYLSANDWQSFNNKADDSNVVHINGSRQLLDTNNVLSVNWGQHKLNDTGGSLAIDYGTRQFFGPWSMNGLLTLSGAPTSGNNAATKAYVDALAISGLTSGYFPIATSATTIGNSSLRGTGTQLSYGMAPLGTETFAIKGAGTTTGKVIRTFQSDATTESFSVTDAGNGYFKGVIQLPTGAVNGYVYTTDGSGNATWQALPSSISGLTSGYFPIATSATTIGNSSLRGTGTQLSYGMAPVGTETFSIKGAGTTTGKVIRTFQSDATTESFSVTDAGNGYFKGNLKIPTGAVNGYVYTTDGSGNASWGTVATSLGYTAANDALVVHIAGTETITGAKTFSAATVMSSTLTINHAASTLIFRESTNNSGYGTLHLGATAHVASNTNYALSSNGSSQTMLNGVARVDIAINSSPVALFYGAYTIMQQKVSIGTGAASTSMLDIKGAGTTSATFAQKTFQSDGTTLTSSIDDAGNVVFKNSITVGNLSYTTAANYGTLSLNGSGGAEIDFKTGGAVSWGIYNIGSASLRFFSGSTDYMIITSVNVQIAGDIKSTIVGKGLYLKEGTNAVMGTSTLVAGTVTVNTTKVTANSRIFINISTPGGVQGITSYTISAGTSFTVTSTNVADTSSFNWVIIEAG
jgi:hypothetical protein